MASGRPSWYLPDRALGSPRNTRFRQRTLATAIDPRLSLLVGWAKVRITLPVIEELPNRFSLKQVFNYGILDTTLQAGVSLYVQLF